MKRFLSPAELAVRQGSGSGPAFDATKWGTPNLWLSAYDSPGDASQFTDLSGNGLHGAQADPAKRAQRQTLSGVVYMVPDGSASCYLVPDTDNLLDFGTGAFSIVIVVNLSTATNRDHLSKYNISATGERGYRFRADANQGESGIYIGSNTVSLADTTDRSGTVRMLGFTRSATGVLRLFVDGSYITQATGIGLSASSGRGLSVFSYQEASAFSSSPMALALIYPACLTDAAMGEIYTDWVLYGK